MARHWITGLIFAALTTVAIAVALVYSPLVGVITFLLCAGIWYSVSIAGLRPRGYEEHDDPKPTRPGPPR